MEKRGGGEIQTLLDTARQQFIIRILSNQPSSLTSTGFHNARIWGGMRGESTYLIFITKMY